MGFLTIYQNNYTDSTVISNRFIDEYMADANDAQLKIYLYLLRTVNARLDTSIGDIADKFNYTEKDVKRALTYWEKKRLLFLDYDSHKNITGIHLLDSSAIANPSVNTAITYPFVNTAPHEQPQLPLEKPIYTADQLRDFKADENTARLLFVAEQYLKNL